MGFCCVSAWVGVSVVDKLARDFYSIAATVRSPGPRSGVYKGYAGAESVNVKFRSEDASGGAHGVAGEGERTLCELRGYDGRDSSGKNTTWVKGVLV